MKHICVFCVLPVSEALDSWGILRDMSRALRNSASERREEGECDRLAEQGASGGRVSWGRVLMRPGMRNREIVHFLDGPDVL